ncbi:hypothetical protein C1X59_05950 [Pseudomonas sp. FW215-R2]|jgi:ribonuclease T2|uniref:ribonuclease T2 family protein n=1 Tax=unclassified Pseudomonas TaxID=196821 RepID=UPI000C883823|nr:MULTISPECIES: hypothetical protein [unclassified Pseudomonas]PMX03162.1 hypothetical protein C1X59_05950 [Pseudomonas sp. FW215-R2]PMX11873.1 hypothetical protein C1X60_04715 [Pseudomonas sp. FW215-L1]PMX25542.1 hypothetical protein C1X57_03450 [Pseudomonas sp. FW215-E1]PNA32544.1 hypothetical protein C1X58_02930 [Pseudomonas sp. FW215-R4]
MYKRRILAITLVSLTPVLATAEPSCKVDPAKKKLYRLELTVPAAFCRSADQEDPSCKQLPKESLVQLHGLWPNYEKNFPEGGCSPGECEEQKVKDGKFCKFPELPKLIASETWKANKDFMAGTEKCLERHEWAKHGTCSPMNVVEYFDWSLSETRHIVESLDITPDVEMTRSEFEQRVQQKLPELNGAVHLNCKGKLVTGMYVLYEWGQTPGAPIKTKSGQNSFGNCKNDFTFVSK